MRVPIKEHIASIKKEGHTKVYFKCEGYGDSAAMDIEEFLSVFAGYGVDLNGEFIGLDGKIQHNNFIKRTA